MFRIQWHVLPDNQVIGTAMTKIYGIWVSTSKKILSKYNIVFHTRVRDITDDQQKLLTEELKEMILESDLKREVMTSIKRLKEIKCYRGMRHIMWLPVRWQSTLRNAKTAKKLLWRSRVRPSLKK